MHGKTQAFHPGSGMSKGIFRTNTLLYSHHYYLIGIVS